MPPVGFKRESPEGASGHTDSDIDDAEKLARRDSNDIF
jgi:hypothetical protein